MKNKLCFIASCCLFFGACAVVLPAHALASAKPTTTFMSRMMPRMQFGAKVGAFVLTACIINSVAETVTNSISHRLFRQDRVGTGSNAGSYVKKGLNVASSVFTQAGINWALLPFLFPQKRHPFQFWLTLTVASAITSAVTKRVTDYCLSKVSSKSTKRLLLSLGLGLPVVAGLEYLKAKVPYAITRSCTGVSESPLMSTGICVTGALFSLLIPSCTCMQNVNSISNVSKSLTMLIGQLQQNPANDELWQQVEKEVDAIKWVFTEERYSFSKLNSNVLLPQFVLDTFLEVKECVFHQLIQLYKDCSKSLLKDKLADILFPSFVRDISSAIDTGEEMFKHEEQTLAYTSELYEKYNRLADLRENASELLRSFAPDQRETPYKIEISALSDKTKELAERMLKKTELLAKSPEVESESIAKNLAMIEQKVVHLSSSIKILSTDSNRVEILELKKSLEELSSRLLRLEEDVLVVPENRLKVNACIASMATKFMQILEPKFTLISQQLSRAALSRQELAKLSNHFSDLIMVKNQSIDPFVRYLDNTVLLDQICQKQIPSLRASFADAAFTLKFKSL